MPDSDDVCLSYTHQGLCDAKAEYWKTPFFFSKTSPAWAYGGTRYAAMTSLSRMVVLLEDGSNVETWWLVENGKRDKFRDVRLRSD